ncbi:hypothetical protein [Pollutibacter soli]|uniref:hypothetical protein n=1 Tax=Pollutibacter soli TaxID=3034157 RepID=UPI003013B3E7
MITKDEIESFIHDGYVKIENAFSKDFAAEARRILWKATGCDPDDPSTWTKPVIRLGYFTEKPFQVAANSPKLIEAYDQLTGAGRWIPRDSVGSFPVRFPSDEDPRDSGWHIDASFPGDDPQDYMNYRVNIFSRGRGLLMLFLFSDVGHDDAPTKMRNGSHLQAARLLELYGETGLSFIELSETVANATASAEEVVATGEAGTVYLCHPFVVHAAQPHRGKNPRFLAQPPLHIKEDLQLLREDSDYSPVEIAIRNAISSRS